MSWPAPVETPSTMHVLRRYWWVLAIVAVLIGMVGVSELSDPADDIRPAIVDMVEMLKADGDCAGLQAAFDRSDDADELRYIDDALDDTGCYD